MKGFKIGGKVEEVKLNKHIVVVIRPKNRVPYEEGSKKVDKIISEIKKKK